MTPRARVRSAWRGRSRMRAWYRSKAASRSEPRLCCVRSISTYQTPRPFLKHGLGKCGTDEPAVVGPEGSMVPVDGVTAATGTNFSDEILGQTPSETLRLAASP